MKKKGFTLIELIAIIVILALIMIIVVPNAIKTGDQVKQDALKTKKENILAAATLYGNDNEHIFKESKGCLFIGNIEYKNNDIIKKEQILQVFYDEETLKRDDCYSYAQISVEQLAKLKYIKFDEKGDNGKWKVINPADSDNDLNDDIVYLYIKHNKIYAIYKGEIISIDDDNCEGDECTENETCTGGNCGDNECEGDDCNEEGTCTGPDCDILEEEYEEVIPDSDCVPGSKILFKNAKASNPADISYSVPCDGVYEITYAGAAGGNGAGSHNQKTRPTNGKAGELYKKEIRLAKSTILMMSIGTKGEDGQTLWNAKGGKSGTYVANSPLNGKNGKMASHNWRDEKQTLVGNVYIGGSGAGGAATKIEIIGVSDNNVIIGANGGKGGNSGSDSDASYEGGDGGVYSNKNTDPESTDYNGEKDKTYKTLDHGFVQLELKKFEGATEFKLKEKCPTPGQIIYDNTGVKSYSSGFVVLCSGKYEIEIAGGGGSITSDSTAGDKEKTPSTKPTGGQIISSTLDLDFKDIITLEVGYKGEPQDKGKGGSGGMPNGKSGTDGIYSIQSKVLVSGGGGGGGGSTTVSINNKKVLTANGGNGADGGHLNLYPYGRGGAGGQVNVDMSAYNIINKGINPNRGYVKITFISKN